MMFKFNYVYNAISITCVRYNWEGFLTNISLKIVAICDHSFCKQLLNAGGLGQNIYLLLLMQLLQETVCIKNQILVTYEATVTENILNNVYIVISELQYVIRARY